MVLGACVSTLFIAKLVGTDLPMVAVIALGMAVWMIYTFDHLKDASTSSIPQTKRHQFHELYKKELKISLGLVSLLGIFILAMLPSQVLYAGFLLSALVGAYFFVLFFYKKSSAYKEISIAILYVLGIFLAPIVTDTKPFTVEIVLLFFIYLLLALINLVSISKYESVIDQQSNQSSIVQLIGIKYSNYVLYVLSLILFILWTIFAINTSFYTIDSWVLLAMCGTMALVFIFPKLFYKSECYRIWSDAVFCFPLVGIV